MQYGSELHMALNHANKQNIRMEMANQLETVGTPRAPIRLTFSECQIGKLTSKRHKRVTHIYDIGYVICTDMCGPMRTYRRLCERYIIKFTDVA